MCLPACKLRRHFQQGLMNLFCIDSRWDSWVSGEHHRCSFRVHVRNFGRKDHPTNGPNGVRARSQGPVRNTKLQMLFLHGANFIAFWCTRVPPFLELNWTQLSQIQHSITVGLWADWYRFLEEPTQRRGTHTPGVGLLIVSSFLLPFLSPQSNSYQLYLSLSL